MLINRQLLLQEPKLTCRIPVASLQPARTASATASTLRRHSLLHTKPSKNAGLDQTATIQTVHSSILPSHFVPSEPPAQTRTANLLIFRPSANSIHAQTPDVHTSMSLVRTGICQPSRGQKIKPINQSSRTRRWENRIRAMLVTESLSLRTKRNLSSRTRDRATLRVRRNRKKYLLEADRVRKRRYHWCLYLYIGHGNGSKDGRKKACHWAWNLAVSL